MLMLMPVRLMAPMPTLMMKPVRRRAIQARQTLALQGRARQHLTPS